MKKVIIILFCALYSAISFAQGLWEMPACAWTRKMGDRPVYSKVKHTGGVKAQTVTKKGMPIGGVGSGSFMYNFCGSFGPFYMKPVVYEERFLSQAAFHVREEV
ncbi:MAG: hypothetical protein LBH60_01915, partial [Prevotellaceae bacterium]|nr:hypothetical protein [Prevotellaceae bacterium]